MAPPRANPSMVILYTCGLVLLLVLFVVMVVVLVKTMVDLATYPAIPTRPSITPTITLAVTNVPAACPVRGKDVTDVRALDQADRAGPVPLLPEPRLREPPVFPSQDPFYPSRGHPASFQQLGIMSAMNDKTGEPIVLPLFGKKIGNGHRDRWNYYAATDKNTLWRIPVSQGDKDCTDRYNGCPEVYDGDTIVVPSYQREFVVSMYPYRDPVF